MRIVILFFAAMIIAGCSGGPDGENMRAFERFTDLRDNKRYRMVTIGNLVWMADNLNYETSESWCYNNADSNCVKYGRLYTWHTAMVSCPSGWRLPTAADWDNLLLIVGDSAGTKLKSRTGWYIGDGHISGTDDFGFAALPGGGRWSDGFTTAGVFGYWWSARENRSNTAWGRNMYYDVDGVLAINWRKDYALSVRCVSDRRVAAR